MKKKQVIIVFIIFLITIALAITCGKTYAKYILTKHYDTTFSSYPFYFEVEDTTKNRLYAREGQVVSLKIMNYVGEKANEFDTKYEISLEENGIFTLEKVEGTIAASKRDKTVDLALKLKPNFTQTGGSITFVVKTIEPYTKEVKIKVSVNKLGDYVLELGKDKKYSYNDATYGLVTRDVIQTDIPCNGAEGSYATPHYYKYISGDNSTIDFNYVWYSGKMWRIMEVFDDGSVKMITENVLSAINFGLTPDWETSFMKQWLNEDFLDTLYNHENILVEDADWDISGWYSYCWHEPPKTVKTTVGLLNPYEYSKVRVVNNYLDLGHSWWLSSPNEYAPESVMGVNQEGGYTSWKLPAVAFGVRPVVILRSDVRFTGNGTEKDPFILLDDKEAAKPGDKINTREEGELVKIDNMLYRIVSTQDYNGRPVTKLSSASYITDDDGSVMLKQFGSMTDTHTYEEVVRSGNENYWGAYLNGSWLTEDLKKYLVEDTYYVDPAQDSAADGSIIGSYKNTICKETDTFETTKRCEKTANTWTGYVGLPIIGEFFAYPLGGYETKDYQMATMTPYGTDDYPMVASFSEQGMFQTEYNQYFAVKPSITLRDDVIIKSGDGKTPSTAFEIKLPDEES